VNNDDERQRIIAAVTQYLDQLPVDRDCGCALGRRWPRLVSYLIDVIRMTP
jgi:hypothetical protein